MNTYFTLPRGFYLYRGACPNCRGSLIEVDRVEGLPIYGCPAKCGRDEPGPNESN